MKKLILAIALLSTSFTALSGRPIDGKAKHIESVKGANAFADYVVASGYRCNSITSFRAALFSSGKFNLKCNNFRYSYTIEDKGGRWIVTVN